MVRRFALLRRLPAVESPGSATAICSNKRGALTQNAMAVTQVWTSDVQLAVSGAGYMPEGERSDDEQILRPGELPDSVDLLCWWAAVQRCSHRDQRACFLHDFARRA